MAFKGSVQTDVFDQTQIERIRKESEQYVDQSVSQTLTQAYAVNLVNHSEDITEMKKNFENYMSNHAASTQDNIIEFEACLELSDFKAEQSNKLVQDVVQGFEQIENEVKEIKRQLETNSTTDTQVDQTATGTQDSTQDTQQSTEAEQESTQSAEKESEKYHPVYGRYNGMLLNQEPMRKYIEERNLAKYGLRDKGLDLEKMKKSGIPVIENFARFHEKYMIKNKKSNRREKFCIFGCVDVQTTVETSTEIIEDTQIDKKTLIQQQNLYESITSAYDKTVDTIIKIIDEVEKKNTAEASAKSSQVNVISIKTPKDACLLKFKNINIKQSNELTQSVSLNIVLESMSTLTSDVMVKAIMADMMGLTQSAEATQTSVQKSKQGSVLKQTSLQTSKQKASSGGGIVLIIIIVVILLMFGGGLFGSGGSYHDTYFDGPIRPQPMMQPGMVPTHPAQQPMMQPRTTPLQRVANTVNAVNNTVNAVNAVRNPVQQPMMQQRNVPTQPVQQPMMQQPMMQPRTVPTQPVQQPMMQPRYI